MRAAIGVENSRETSMAFLGTSSRQKLTTTLEEFDLGCSEPQPQVADAVVDYALDVIAILLHTEDLTRFSLAVIDDLAGVPRWCRRLVIDELAALTARTLLRGADGSWASQPLLDTLDMTAAVGLIGPEQRHLLATWMADVLWASATDQPQSTDLVDLLSIDAMRVPFAGAVGALASRVDPLEALNDYIGTTG